MLSYNVTGLPELVLFYPSLALPGILLGIFLRLQMRQPLRPLRREIAMKQIGTSF